MDAPARHLALFRRYVGPQWRAFALLGGLLLAGIALALAGPQLLRAFIDRALAGAPLDELVRLALAFAALALLTQLVSAAAQYLGESIGWTATNALRADLALHCLRLDLGFHTARTPGELIERIDGDVTALGGFFSRFVVNVLGNALLLVGVLAVVTAEDVRAGLALAVFVGLAVVLLFGPLRTIAVGRWATVREASAQLHGFLNEHLGGTEDLRASGAVDHALRGLGRHHGAWLRARRGAMLATSFIWGGTLFTFAVGNAIAFAVGGMLWSRGEMTLGTVYLLFYYTALLRRPLEVLRRELEEVQRAIASLGRVDELFATRSRLADGPGALPAGALAVELDQVTFGYGAEPVLREVTLRVQPGRVLGVLGRTGGGKTTIARLLLRFYDPDRGSVRLGGRDLRAVRLDELRGRATLVSQDVQLFAASIRDNLTFFDRDVDDVRIVAVLERIGLGPWLRARAPGPDGTLLGAPLAAGGLSAGEAQLLAFARVFLRDPGLVILDEASSRLDPATERRIEAAIGALLAGRTGIVIAHRLATVERCDDVCVVEDGRVVEHGPRAALAADPGSRFAALLRAGLAEAPA